MRVFTEQVCGPLVRVTAFDTDEEAAALANAVSSPTAAYIWAGDPGRAHRLAPAIESAASWVNSYNPLDRLATAASRPGESAADVDIDFYRQSRTVLTAAGEAPVPRF
jgi:acyl-CoA reductase-like NAD-dependent aldehyde dehydrogenase